VANYAPIEWQNEILLALLSIDNLVLNVHLHIRGLFIILDYILSTFKATDTHIQGIGEGCLHCLQFYDLLLPVGLLSVSGAHH
jgi:hypothetical protein